MNEEIAFSSDYNFFRANSEVPIFQKHHQDWEIDLFEQLQQLFQLAVHDYVQALFCIKGNDKLTHAVI